MCVGGDGRHPGACGERKRINRGRGGRDPSMGVGGLRSKISTLLPSFAECIGRKYKYTHHLRGDIDIKKRGSFQIFLTTHG